MDQTRMPSHVKGEWIWTDSLIDSDDTFLLFRKEFTLDHFGLDAGLWISANCAYKLYINDRLIGAGPRPNQNPGVSYVDLHDAYYCLQSGINVIAVIAYFSSELLLGSRRTPGIWCQLESEGRTLVYSDKTWDISGGEAMTVPRARGSRHEGLLEYVEGELHPQHWTSNSFLARENWTKPTYSKPATEYGTRLEIHPLRPPHVERKFDFAPMFRGVISDTPEMTFVSFRQVHLGGRGSYGAQCYVRRERDSELPVRIFSDEPFRLFCNGEPVHAGAGLMGDTVVFPFRSGWNTITLFQSTTKNAMGMYLEFPRGSSIEPRIVPEPDADAAWKTAGPFKMSFESLPGDLDFDRLKTADFEPKLENVTDISSFLVASKLIRDPEPKTGALKSRGMTLRTGECAVFRLDDLRYGFPIIDFHATRNDIVDFTIGYILGDNNLPNRGDRRRCTHTIRCRSKENNFTFFRPRECCYLAVSVRKAVGEVRLESVRFAELSRNRTAPSSLKTSEKWINELWNVGVLALTRSAGFVSVNEPRANYDSYMFDAYIESVNMICTFGDFSYSAAKLREFVKGQFENGDIPAISSSGKPLPQGPHSFVMPLWIAYNYRTSGDVSELDKLAVALKHLAQYWEKRRGKDGLLHEDSPHFHPKSRVSLFSFSPDEAPTYLNALYSRFLLSAAQVFKLSEMKDMAQHCITVADEVISTMRRYNEGNTGDEGLMPMSFVNGRPHGEADLMGNFCALLGGVLELGKFDIFQRKFFRFDSREGMSAEEAQPYFHFLCMDMMFSLDLCDWGFDYFRRYWEEKRCPHMSAWRLDFTTDDPAPVRMYDGWTVSPNMVILRDIVGVRVDEQSAVTTVFLNPRLELLDSIELNMPLSKGKFFFKLDKNDDDTMDITLDANFELRVVPEFTPEVLKHTSFALGQEVQLFSKN